MLAHPRRIFLCRCGGLLALAISLARPGPAVAADAPAVAGLYRGTLDGVAIELVLTVDADAKDSVHGWYTETQAAGPGAARVLLAGEFEGDQLSLEESRNGVDVSGTWYGTLSAAGFQGNWSDAQGEHEKPVVLSRVAIAPDVKKP